MTDLRSKAVARTSGSNFISSFWFLPAHKRRAMNVIYAYCRLTDDIVDLAQEKGTPPNAARQELEEWRKLTAASARGSLPSGAPPVLQELSRVIADYKISEEHFMGLIDGCQMDLEKNSYASFGELYEYCYRVAGTVGLMCLPVFGAGSHKSKDYAVALGIAFQLTNILRDVRSDALRGRVYLPEEDLAKFGLSKEELPVNAAREPRPAGFDDKFEKLMGFEIARAEEYYGQARNQLDPLDRKALVAAQAMAAVYHAILEKIHARPLAVLEGKVRLSRLEAAFRVLGAWVSA